MTQEEWLAGVTRHRGMHVRGINIQEKHIIIICISFTRCHR